MGGPGSGRKKGSRNKGSKTPRDAKMPKWKEDTGQRGRGPTGRTRTSRMNKSK